MRYIESEAVELKEKFTDVICKDIVAFLNTSGGILILGVRDDGTVVGVKKIDETMKKISDVITMQIEPNPQDEIRSELKFEDGKTLIVVYVNKGIRNIYCQKRYGFSSSGCVVRVGTTCAETSDRGSWKHGCFHVIKFRLVSENHSKSSFSIAG